MGAADAGDLQQQAFSGIRVFDATQGVAGPHASMLLADPHVTAVDALPAVEHDGTGTVPMANVPGLPPIEAGQANAHAPHLGEHTRAILTEAGYDADAIESLERVGVYAGS